jgi:hypothetical protein
MWSGRAARPFIPDLIMLKKKKARIAVRQMENSDIG